MRAQHMRVLYCALRFIIIIIIINDMLFARERLTEFMKRIFKTSFIWIF